MRTRRCLLRFSAVGLDSVDFGVVNQEGGAPSDFGVSA